MSVLTLKIGFALVGVVTWIYGMMHDDSSVTLLGIGFLAIAFVLRFVRPRRLPQPPELPKPPKSTDDDEPRDAP